MRTCGICGVLYSGEVVRYGKHKFNLCPKCEETAKHHYFLICPECEYSSWINTDQIVPFLTFVELTCPDCQKEFHTIDGFKRRSK